MTSPGELNKTFKPYTRQTKKKKKITEQTLKFTKKNTEKHMLVK